MVNPDLLQNIITDKFNKMNQKDFVEFLEGKQSLDLKFEYQDPIQAELIELDLAIRNLK